MSTPVVQNFSLHAGDDKTISVKVTADGTPTGAVVDISGATIIWKASRGNAEKFSSTPTLTKTTTPTEGIEITDGPQGEFEITLDSADTENLRGDYYIEAETTSGGNKTTTLVGVMTIKPTLVK